MVGQVSGVSLPRRLGVLGLLVVLVFTACQSDSGSPPPRARSTVDVSELYKRECIIDLAPRNYNPQSGQMPTVLELADDLSLLQEYGFTGVVTYSAQGSLALIPQLAKEGGFEIVGMGISDPANEEELEAAVRQQGWVDFYVVGNEGLTTRSYSLDDLTNAIEWVREATGKPVSTTDTMAAYQSEPRLYEIGDWVSVNHHPFWAGIREPGEAAEWLGEQYNQIVEDIQRHRNDRRLVFGEVGWPTGGDPQVSEADQLEFFRQVGLQPISGGRFEAFDQTWKTVQPVEPHWGIFSADGSPKPAAEVVCGKPRPVPTQQPESPTAASTPVGSPPTTATRPASPAPAASPPTTPAAPAAITPSETPPPMTTLAETPAPVASSPAQGVVLQTLTLGYADFALEEVCTYEANYCGYADRVGKAVVYGSMTSQLAVPAGATELEVQVSIPCNGWGEGLAGPAGSSALIGVDGKSSQEVIDSSMAYHHGTYYRFEYCTTWSARFSVAGKGNVTLHIEMAGGARMDFQTATLLFRG